MGCCGCVSCGVSTRFFFFSSRRRHTRLVSDWSSDVCSSDLKRDAAQIACPGCQRLRGIALAFSVAGVRAFGMDVGDAQGEFDLATQTLKVAGECVIHGPKAVPEHVDVGDYRRETQR